MSTISTSVYPIMSSRALNNGISVSIVAPVYNVSEYLPAFVKSVLEQTLISWELILVDDGSTDSSGDICDSFAQKDNRIKVFHQSNCGVGSARNVALKAIKGDWVLMPDPDDILPYDCLETLLNATSEQFDLISASYTCFYNNQLINSPKESQDIVLSHDDFISFMGITPRPRNFDRRCCNKLFRSSIIKENHIYFPEDLHYREDILYNYLFLSYTKKNVRCLSYDMYIYYRRDSGAAISLQKAYTPKSGGLFLAMTRCYDILEQMGASEATKKRMKSELLNTYKSIIKLIDDSGSGKNDKCIYTKKLLQYFGILELFSYWCSWFLRRIINIHKLHK